MLRTLLTNALRLKGLLVFILLISLMSCSAPPTTTPSAPSSFQEGKDYTVIPSTTGATTPSPAKIEVVEFFSYGCPWCYRFEPYLRAWIATKPKDVEFERVPVIFEPGWEMLARAYYTARNLGVADKLTPALFEAIQVQGMDLTNKDALAQFFTSHGVSQADFDSTFNFSPGIDAEVIRGDNLMRAYGVYEVPTLVVNGKYVTNVRMTGGDNNRLIEVLNYLVEKERQGGN